MSVELTAARVVLAKLDFSDKPILEALRAFMRAHVLPESGKWLAVVLEIFGSQWFKQYKGAQMFASEVAAFTFTYSLIILDSDLRNPQMKRKMTLEMFMRTNDMINDGRALPAAFMEEMYTSIKERPLATTTTFDV